jgi:thermostable 8-oxoguanine DNA glycosylase
MAGGGMATMLQLQDLKQEILNAIGTNIADVLTHVNDRYKENQADYTKAIDSSMQDLRAQIIANHRSENVERVEAWRTNVEEQMKDVDARLRNIVSDNVKELDGKTHQQALISSEAVPGHVVLQVG